MQRQLLFRGIITWLGIGLLIACNPNPPTIVVITATPFGAAADQPPAVVAVPTVAETGAVEVLPPPSLLLPPAVVTDRPDEHTVLPGESLSLIAQQYGTTLQTLVALNQLTDPDRIEVGQVIVLPSEATQQAPVVVLLPDRRLVRGPDSAAFDTAAFIAQQPGYIRTASDTVTTNQADGTGLDQLLSAAQVVERVAMEYSVDPRLLLAVLEYRSQWLSVATPRVDQILFPIVPVMSAGFNRSGLYRQLSYVANELNRGYYAFRTRGLRTIEFDDGTRLLLPAELNPATVGLMYFLSLNSTFPNWQTEISNQGLITVYRSLFGDPFLGGNEPLVPAGLSQPEFMLPFAQGEVWLYTGGAHGGWGSGSAWASVDFAPPDERPENGSYCYTSTTPVRAVANGILARSADGAVVLDLDGDADERTGWTVMYLHLTQTTPAGTTVRAGHVVGYASCAGGFSTATHLHLTRRYNGEWLAADCSQCSSDEGYASFAMTGWTVEQISGQEYQGYLVRGSLRQVAEQGRETTINRISW